MLSEHSNTQHLIKTIATGFRVTSLSDEDEFDVVRVAAVKVSMAEIFSRQKRRDIAEKNNKIVLLVITLAILRLLLFPWKRNQLLSHFVPPVRIEGEGTSIPR